MSKTEPADTPPKKSGKKKYILIGGGALLLSGAGAAAGMYAAGTFSPDGKHAEKPHLPKLVERSKEPAHAEAGGHGEEKPAARVGTVEVESDRAKVDAKRYEAAYIPVETPFTANLAGGSGFVQMGLSLATYYDDQVVGNVGRQIVPIRSAILMILSDQDAALVSTPEGKRRLQKELTVAINGVLREKEGFGGIDNVYFTSLVVQ